jgi:basic membrane protein A
VVRSPFPLRTLALTLALLAASAAVPLEVRAGTAARPRVLFVGSSCGGTEFLCPAFRRALEGSGVTGTLISPDPREDQVSTLSLLAQRGYRLVIVDFAWADALRVVAPRYPKSRFALFDAPLALVGVRPNVEGLIIDPTEAAYLAGWLAAEMARRSGKHVLGVVGGEPIPSVDDFIRGFRLGALHADPKVRVLTRYSHDFVDTVKCAALARSEIAHGATVVFDVAGVCGLGALDAARQAGVWGVGVDVDQSSRGPHILTSVVKRYDVGFDALLQQARTGTIHRGTTILGLRDGGAGLGRISPRVPATVRAGLSRVRSQILRGTIRVPGDPG